MEIKIVKNSISKKEILNIAKEQFGEFVKAVVDIEQGIMAFGGELHADEEVELMEKEKSKREYTWGVNLYPEEEKEKWIVFDSMVNIKPFLNNRSRGIESSEIKEKIKNIVNKLVIDADYS